MAHAAFTTATAFALDQTDLDTNRSLWDSQSASDYDYFLQRSCFCFPDTRRPGLVSVRSGVITMVIDAETSAMLDPQSFLRVDELFDTLQDAIDTNAFEINSQFDNILGYPRSFSIDYFAMIADDEIYYTARDLVVVPEPASGLLMLLGLVAVCQRCRPQWHSQSQNSLPGKTRQQLTDFATPV